MQFKNNIIVVRNNIKFNIIAIVSTADNCRRSNITCNITPLSC